MCQNGIVEGLSGVYEYVKIPKKVVKAHRHRTSSIWLTVAVKWNMDKGCVAVFATYKRYSSPGRWDRVFCPDTIVHG
jgi:hypothetical protein